MSPTVQVNVLALDAMRRIAEDCVRGVDCETGQGGSAHLESLAGLSARGGVLNGSNMVCVCHRLPHTPTVLVNTSLTCRGSQHAQLGSDWA
jgi:hypothetical protein